MSLHSTLKSKGGLVRHRNVLTREERLRHLELDGNWDESQSVLGLPKVRNILMKAGGKKKKDEEEDAATTTTTTTTTTPDATPDAT